MKRDDERRDAANGVDGDGGALVRRPVDPQRLLAAVADPEAGANVLFVGTARAVTNGRPAVALEFDAHEPMAGPELERLCKAAVEKFGLVACAVEHRLGRVPVGEASVAIAASAPHRREAFAAAEWLMERIKREVPIWKCEERADGRRDWIHPGGGAARPEATGRGPRSGERPRGRRR
jgi:molybdopterin synthase catalytic subunit